MADDAPTPEEQKPKSKLPMKMIIIMASVFVIEAAVISMFWMMKGGPDPAEATEAIEDTEKQASKDMAEVELAARFQVDNYMKGSARTMVTLEVSGTYLKGAPEEVEAKKLEVEELVTTNKSQILDKVRMIVSSAKPNDLTDPKLEVIKRIIKSEVEQIIGEGVIIDILLPKWSAITIE